MSLPALGHLLAVVLLAYFVWQRVALLRSFAGLPGYLLTFALTRFGLAWVNLCTYAILGWGTDYNIVSWLLLLGPLAWLAATTPAPPLLRPGAERHSFIGALMVQLRDHGWFLVLAVFVVARFYAGLDEDDEGQIWVVFNFVDTAFHLSVANAFLETPRFPPMDFDFPPFPLKYHFLADFNLAHFIQRGVPPLRAIWLLNLFNAAAFVGALWAVFQRWLRLPARWVMLGAFVFLFLNTSVVNLLHYLLLRPAYFDASQPFVGVLRFPYFNFESVLANLLEPQRGLLFSLPILLFVLHLLFGDRRGPQRTTDEATRRARILAAGCLICLLPLAHIVGFVVLGLCIVPALIRHFRWIASRVVWWLPAIGLLAFQLIYLFRTGTPTNPHFSGWDVVNSIPTDEFRVVPPFLRRAVFWFFANGDFFCWSALLAALAFWRLRTRRAASVAGAFRVRKFLHDWRWYFAVCLGLFALINFYRYSHTWGDSNKFVLFLNLGLALVITLGCAQWRNGPRRVVSHLLWIVLLLLTTLPPTVTFVRRVILYPQENNLFFHRYEIIAADWLKKHAGPGDFVLTAAFTDAHFISPLAAQPSVAGIYADTNPNFFPGRGAAARRVYEEDALALLGPLSVRYICVSRTERRIYRLSPHWRQRMRDGTGVVYHAGEPDEFESVYIFDVTQLVPQKEAVAPAAASAAP